MLCKFNLRPGVTFEQASKQYFEFFNQMQRAGLAEGSGKLGKRVVQSPMDTDEQDHSCFVVMSFKDRAQLDHSYEMVANGRLQQDQLAPHDFIKSAIKDAVFTCWDDEV